MNRHAWLLVLVCACGKSKGHAPAKTEGSAAPHAAATKLGPAIDVAVTQSHVCAVLASGQVACWGEIHGSLEPLTTRPVLITGVTGATSIADGEDCVLRGAKSAMCWDNERAASELPGTEGARQLVHGEWQPCFVLADNSVSCWDDRTKKLAPVSGLTGVRSLDHWAYNEWCYVRDKDGAIVCTGDHADDLGKNLPVFPDAITVSRVEQSVACVFRKGGAIACFGTYADVITKLPTQGDQLYRAGTLDCVRNKGALSCRPWGEDAWKPRALAGQATDLSCESNACCAVTTGAIECWGDNQDGRLGDGVPAHSSTPVKVDKLPPVAKLIAGERFTIAMTRDDVVYAWGGSGKGPHVPARIAEGPFVSIASAGSIAVAARESSIRIMGSDGERWDSESLPAPPAKPRSVAVDDASNFCVATSNGMTYCLREDAGGGEPRWMPIRGITNAMELSGSGGAVCGVTDAGTVACMLDERDEDDTKAPPRSATVLPGIAKARHIQIPYVELADGSVVRIETDDNRHWLAKPLPELAGFTGISTGGYSWSSTCAIKDKRASCWFVFGDTGDPRGVLAREADSKVPTGTPASVAGSHEATAVAAGNSHACLVDVAGAVWCWGDDRYGSLGQGRVTFRDDAARVVDIGP